MSGLITATADGRFLARALGDSSLLILLAIFVNIPIVAQRVDTIQVFALNRKDWLFSAIAQAGERGLSPIQIQKAMFLLRMEASEAVGRQFYAFTPYNYGPFSSSIYGDVDLLVASGYVRETNLGHYSRYLVTDSGRDRAASLLGQMPGDAREYLSNMIIWILSVDFTQLLRSIYAKYPDYARNSVFRY